MVPADEALVLVMHADLRRLGHRLRRHTKCAASPDQRASEIIVDLNTRSVYIGRVTLRPVSNPPNPWLSSEVEYLPDEVPEARLEIFEDHTRTILASNDSPDVGFDFSVNPYRGCQHACAYCYARPGHEYLSFGAGTDFDRKIVVKPRAPELLREAFDKKSWKGDLVVFSGVTDCYQPLEASLPADARLPRGLRRVSQPRRHHHQGAAHRARPRRARAPQRGARASA